MPAKLGLPAALLILGAIALVSYGSISRFADDARWVDHSHQVMLALEEFMYQVETAVATQRGYLIAGDERYLSRYEAAAKQLPHQIQALREMTADNPRQQRSVVALEPLVSSRLAVLDHGIALKQAARLDSASARPILARGQKIMDQIRELASETKTEEGRLLNERSQALEKEKLSATLVIAFGNLVAFALLVFAFLILMRQIQGRKAVERHLREANAFLDSVFEHIPAGVFVKDAKDLRFVRHNKANQEILGYSEEELLGKSDYDLFPRAQADFFTSKDRMVLAGKTAVDIAEEPIQTRAGAERILHTRKIPVFDGAGDPRYLVGISEDITDRKRAEQALKESQQRLDLALESARLGSWDLDLVTDTSVRSPRHDEIFGYQEPLPNWGAEIFMRHVVSQDRESVSKSVKDALRTGKFSMECRINRVDGCVRWIAAEGQLFRDGSGKPVKIRGVLADITERKEAEGRISALNASLEQQSAALIATNKELESFSYSVSHDLRSPLRAIDGFSLMLQEDYAASLDDEGKRLLKVIQDNSRKMAQLIDDLLAFSRLGRQLINATEVDMTALAQEVFREVPTDLGHAVPSLVLPPLPPARGDRTLLRQVWVNLLSNAVKYSGNREKPLVEITGQLNGTHTIYSVKDNGVGFDMQYYSKLFGVFQRLHSAEEFPGTGVGLAIVQRVVARHGGRVWAEGKPNEGAVFYFSLPKEASDGRSAAG